MNHSEMHDLMLDVFDELEDLRDAGQKEYAHDSENVFANFDRTAERLKISREKALMVHLTKHYDGLTAYVNGHDSQRESVYGRIKDTMMYLMLLYGMVEEAESEEEVCDGSPVISEAVRNAAKLVSNHWCNRCGNVRTSEGCKNCPDPKSPTYSDPPQWWRPETKPKWPYHPNSCPEGCPCSRKAA